MSTNALPTSFEAEIIKLIEDLVRQPAPDKARIDVALGEGRGSFVTVVPNNPLSAAIHLHFYGDPGLVDFSFGAPCSGWELEGDDYLERLRSLTKAVIVGKCGDRRGFIARTSWVEPAEGEGKIRSSSFFYPRIWPASRRFAPYAE